MDPHIEAYSHSMKLFTMERGKYIYEYCTEDRRDVIYYILYNVIGNIAYRKISAKYTDAKGTLHYNDGIRKENNQLIEGAFGHIGEVYDKWYKAGRTPLNMELSE